jgi:hypothetical protein
LDETQGGDNGGKTKISKYDFEGVNFEVSGVVASTQSVGGLNLDAVGDSTINFEKLYSADITRASSHY